MIDIDKISDVVKLTLGAKGKNIVLPDGSITKDGVSVAKAFPTKSQGDKIIKQVALKTLDDVGDGTTSSTVLAQSIYNELKYENFHKISKDLDKEIEFVKTFIEQNSSPIKNKSNLYDIAKIASNGDEEISKVVSSACHKIGKDGNITFEISENNESKYVIDNGFSIKDGMISSELLKGDSEIFENPVVIVCKDELRSVNQILKVTEEFALKQKRPLIIVCDVVDNDIISSFILSRKASVTTKLAIISTTDIEQKFNNLALLTDAQVLNSDEGRSSYDINPDWVGTCKKAVIYKDKTVFVHNKELKNKPKDMKASEWKKIISKIATIFVGGDSRLETTEKLDRYDDALRSTMSSFEEGYCYGGGTVFLRAAEHCTLLRKPLRSLFVQMCKNAGYSKWKTRIIANKIIDSGKVYDFREERFTNKDIYDSAKVLRITLESASSISKLLLTTGYVMGEDDVHSK